MQIFDVTMQRLEYSLEGISAEEQAISSNISNVDTPGYQAIEVPFEAQLQQAIGNNDSGSGVPSGVPAAENEQGLTAKNDGNNVNIDSEMSNLAKTGLEYNTMTNLTQDKFNLLQLAISPIH